jgi:hypothetical protein
MTSRNRREGGECCVRGSDGRLSAYPLQDQMVEGVDDSEFRERTRRRLLEGGLTPEQLDGLFPDLPPSGRSDGR